jgi:P-type Ca2+ transporter type 2C
LDVEESLKHLEKLHANEVYQALGTTTQGLNSEEVVKRQKEYGMNAISEKKGKPAIFKLLANFTHLMAILLWVGGVVAIIGDLPELAIAIWMVNIINGGFSFWQEHRAGKATEALKKLLPTYAHVIRDGQANKVLAEELVPGDVIILAEGDLISADARLVDDNDLRVNQSTLTGESNPIRKSNIEIHNDDITKAEQKNMVFAGTTVSAGTGKAVVYATGMRTEFGKIAGLTQNMKEEQSPLQKEMGKVTRTVSIMAMSIGFIFFLLSVFLVGTDLPLAIVFSMGMIVAFVPEGLLPTVTLSLAMGVQRMAKRNALIKRLSAVETLGCTTVICTDKTGTLTQNEMTVSNIYFNGRSLNVTGVGYGADGKIFDDDKEVEKDNRDLKELLTAAALCSNARLLPPNEEIKKWVVLGDPTEACLLVVAGKYGINLDKENTNIPRLREIPFDSSRKRMSTIHQLRGERISYTKGAPKEVLEISKWIRIDGQDQLMTEEKFREIMEVNDNYARNGLRVLGVAIRKLTKELNLPKSMGDYTYENIEQDLVFLGLVAMVDPPRVEVAEAVAKCRHAGIRIIMITGDYGLTAESIAKKIGIVESDKPRILTGLELETISDEDLKIALKEEVIFARVAPEQKLRVVTNLQEMDEVVAVTGDGVNDSPALKKADIGVAMGMTGTDVAKEAADMILTDDNFASIVNAVEEGRTVYNNIRKFAMYIFTSNVPEAVPMVFYLLSKGAIPLPLTIMQVLAIDLGTDMVPAMGLGAEAPEAGIMSKPPRARNERLLSKELRIKAFLWYGPIEAFAAMASFFFLYWLYGWRGGAMAQDGNIYAMATAMTFGAIVLVQVGNVFASRTDRMSILKKGFFTNRLIIVGIVVEIALLAILLYVPFFNKVFNTAPIGLY